MSSKSCASDNGGGSLQNPRLMAFLQGTRDRNSPLYRLRGITDILRIIWKIACEEWWDLHIDRFPNDIPCLVVPYALEEDRYPDERRSSGGCPIAIIAKDVQFPAPVSLAPGTIAGQEGEHLYVNMMPIDPFDLDRLPDCCKQYIPMIRKCLHFALPPRLYSDLSHEQTRYYLTIDERPVKEGRSQRRGGLHVESPGFLPLLSPDAVLSPEARYLPGQEHHWGGGMMMRDEQLKGGIFMGSNVTNSCAIWNAKIADRRGDIIGPHGNIERLRELLGPPAMKLSAGDLVWMTDKTPHESLPLHRDTTRQYFRLVTGEISAWFADHSTGNPCGVMPAKGVRIVRGDKFKHYEFRPFIWENGSPIDLETAREENDLRALAYVFEVGHLVEALIRAGINNTGKLAEYKSRSHNWWEEIEGLFEPYDKYGKRYRDLPQLLEFVRSCA